MKIEEYANSRDEGIFFVVPEVLYAGKFLEREGEMFNLGFGIDNAVSKAAEMYTVFLDEQLFNEGGIQAWKKLK